MSQSKKLIPKRRFREFEGRDEWKTVNLKDVTDTLSYGLNAAAKNYDGYNKYLRITDIDDESREFKDDSLTSPDINLALAKNYKLKIGDILFARTGASVGKTYHYKESDGTVYYAGFLICLRLKSLYSSDFIYQNTLTKRYKKFIQLTSQRSGQPGVNAQEYGSFVLAIPNFREQTQIGEFFKKLDNLIQTQQKKLHKAKTLKSAYLAEMFPCDGELKPKLRFDGFSEDWSSVAIAEISEIVRGASPRPIQDKKWFDRSSQIGWLRISDVTEQNGRIYYLEQRLSKAGQEKTRVLYEPHLLLSIAATVGKPVINYVKIGVHDGFLIFLNPKFHPEFMFQYLDMFRPQWQKYGQSGSQVNLNSDIVKNHKIALPTIKEQTKIGNFFKLLDQKIALEQRKLDKLNNIKHAYLNEMFV